MRGPMQKPRKADLYAEIERLRALLPKPGEVILVPTNDDPWWPEIIAGTISGAALVGLLWWAL